MPSTSQVEDTEEEQRKSYEAFLEQKALEKPARPQLNVPVDKDHGLFQFFRQLIVDDVPTYEVVESKLRPSTGVGRSWNPIELRRKSFKDLHTLWYIVLRERNLLATQRAEAKRLGISEQYLDVGEKDRRCRKTMARIKTILSERMHAYEQAYSIQRQQRQGDQKRIEEGRIRRLKAAAAKERALVEARKADDAVQVPTADPSDVTVQQVQPRGRRTARRRLDEGMKSPAEAAVTEPASSSVSQS